MATHKTLRESLSLKILFTLVGIILLSKLTLAATIIPIPIAVDYDHSNPSAEQSRAKLDQSQLIEFSIDKDCKLVPYTTSSINEFYCHRAIGGYYLKIDSKGDIVESNYEKVSTDFISVIILVSLIVIVGMVIVWISTSFIRSMRGM